MAPSRSNCINKYSLIICKLTSKGLMLSREYRDRVPVTILPYGDNGQIPNTKPKKVNRNGLEKETHLERPISKNIFWAITIKPTEFMKLDKYISAHTFCPKCGAVIGSNISRNQRTKQNHRNYTAPNHRVELQKYPYIRK